MLLIIHIQLNRILSNGRWSPCEIWIGTREGIVAVRNSPIVLWSNSGCGNDSRIHASQTIFLRSINDWDRASVKDADKSRESRRTQSHIIISSTCIIHSQCAGLASWKVRRRGDCPIGSNKWPTRMLDQCNLAICASIIVNCDCICCKHIKTWLWRITSHRNAILTISPPKKTFQMSLENQKSLQEIVFTFLHHIHFLHFLHFLHYLKTKFFK